MRMLRVKRSGNEISQLVSKLCFNNRVVNNLSLSRKARERRGGGHSRHKGRRAPDFCVESSLLPPRGEEGARREEGTLDTKIASGILVIFPNNFNC
jgi:hypothetical protein